MTFLHKSLQIPFFQCHTKYSHVKYFDYVLGCIYTFCVFSFIKLQVEHTVNKCYNEHCPSTIDKGFVYLSMYDETGSKKNIILLTTMYVYKKKPKAH